MNALEKGTEDMTMSINTNAAAFTALYGLNKTTAELEVAQNRVNTGLKIATAKDNAAYFAIAQKMRGDIGALASATNSMNRVLSTVDVALAAADSIHDLLVDLKGIAVDLADSSLSTSARTALQADYNSIVTQITDMADAAEFNGANLLNSTGAVSAIISADATRSFAVNGIAVATTIGTISTAPTSASAATSRVAQVEAVMDNFASQQAVFASSGRRLEAHLAFAQRLSDAIEVGIGNLVDADIARESAKLQSLQIKQQLGLQALAIANQAPQAILALFR